MSRQLFCFLTQEGGGDTWHLLGGGSNLELNQFCFAFPDQLAWVYAKEMEAAQDGFVQYNPKEQRKYLWDGTHATDQVSGLECPLVADMPIHMEEFIKGGEGGEIFASCFLLFIFPSFHQFLEIYLYIEIGVVVLAFEL